MAAAIPQGQMPDPGESRFQAFNTGRVGDPSANVGVRSEVYQSEAFNRLVPHQMRPGAGSVLVPIMKNPGGLGMGQGDKDRRWADGTYQGSVNATSESSFAPAALLRMVGEDSI